MGCSPPDWYFEQQDRINIERRKREHQERVSTLLTDLTLMAEDEKTKFKQLLGLDKQEEV